MWDSLILIYGAAKAYELTGGPAKTAEAVKDLFGTTEPKPDGREPLRIPPGMTREQSHVYYQGLSEDLVDLWTKPLESRGNATTQHGNKIVANECHDVLKTEFPELLGKIDHIGGADFRGKGKRLKEWTLLNKKTGLKNRSRADLTWGQIDGNGRATGGRGAVRARMNTQDMTKGGNATAWEKLSLARLIKNAGGELVEAVRKLKKGDDEDAYRREVREKCRTVMKGLKKQLEELEKNQDNSKDNENETDESQSNGDGDE